MGAGKGHRSFTPQTLYDLQAFLHSRQSHAWGVEWNPCLVVFLFGPSGTDPELKPAIGQHIKRRRFFCQETGMAEVVVEDLTSQADSGSGFGCSHEARNWRERVEKVVRHDERGIAEGF